MYSSTMEEKFRLRVILVGESSTGKTGLRKLLINKKFVAELYKPTIGADVDFIEFPEYTMMLWDTAGQKWEHDNYFKAFRGTDVAIFVYAINYRPSFEVLGDILDRFLHNTDNPKLQLLIIGNKLDLSNERKVSTDEGEKFALEHNAMFMEFSAKDGDNSVLEAKILEVIEKAKLSE